MPIFRVSTQTLLNSKAQKTHEALSAPMIDNICDHPYAPIRRWKWPTKDLMTAASYSAFCFEILPSDDNWYLADAQRHHLVLYNIDPTCVDALMMEWGHASESWDSELNMKLGNANVISLQKVQKKEL